jgi:c-di-GMP-binding flagellar brake protein YcgR
MRNDVRIDVNIGIKYWIDPESEILCYANDKDVKYDAAITNISAGGGFIITKSRLFFKNFLIKVEIKEKELSFLKNLTAKIVRVKKLRGDKEYGLAFMFINMFSKDKERLIKWIFQVQLEQQQQQKERLANR